MENYSTTFGRVFGSSGESNAMVDRDIFGVGFKRGQATYSPPPRTRCVQDIIMRDKTGVQADLPPAARTSPTFNVTSTTYMTSSPLRRACPSPVRSLLGLGEGLATAQMAQREDESKQQHMMLSESTLRDRSPNSGFRQLVSPRDVCSPRQKRCNAPEAGAFRFNAPRMNSPSRSPSPDSHAARSPSPHAGRSPAPRAAGSPTRTGVDERLGMLPTKRHFASRPSPSPLVEQDQRSPRGSGGGRGHGNDAAAASPRPCQAPAKEAKSNTSEADRAPVSIASGLAPGALELRSDGCDKLKCKRASGGIDSEFRCRELVQIRQKEMQKMRWR